MTKIINIIFLIFCFWLNCSEAKISGHHRITKAINKVVFDDSEDMNLSADMEKNHPISIDTINLQILDKISGKVLHHKIQTNETFECGSLKITLKKAFANNPEEEKEIYALLSIEENSKIIFNNWIFASSPSVNLFEHRIYDLRVEFQDI